MNCLYNGIFRSQIIINKEATKPTNHTDKNWAHYNMKNSPTGREVWDVKKLLEVGDREICIDKIHFMSGRRGFFKL